MLICSLIFMMGNYSVVKSVVYCADFVEAIPNCVALYFLLIAQRMPEDKRTLVIDAGAGVNKKPLIDAIAALKICDDHWSCKVH